MTFKVKDGVQVGSILALDANAKLTTGLSTARTIALSGDVAGSTTFDGTGNVTISTTIQANSVALGTDTTGNYMVNVAAGTGVSVSHTQGEGSTATVSIGQPVATTDNVTFANINATGNVVIDGNLTVSGTTVTISATNLAVEDNMIYLNNGSTVSNPDLGFAGNYNDGSYKHAGFFRDATDGRWKVFQGYTLEPDASAFIDTAHASFALADIQASTFHGALSGNASTASKWATARTLSYTGDATGSMSVDGSANASAALTLANSGVTAGTYGSGTAIPVLTIDAKGRVTSATTSAVTIGAGTLALSIGTAGATNTTVTVGTGSGFNANSTSNYTYDIKVGPALTALATLMTSGSTGFIKRTGVDTYSIDTNTYLTGTKVDSISATSPIVASASTGAITLSHANSGVTAGTYNNVTVNATGHVTSASNVSYLTSYTETDTLATVTGRGATTSTAISLTGSSAINTTTPGTGTYGLNFTSQSTADYAQAITWGWSTNGAQAGIYVQSSGAYGTKMYLATTDSFASGSKTAISIDHTGVVQTTRNYLQASGSLRAPIFYDSDNTSYWLNPSNTSGTIMSTGASTDTLGYNVSYGIYIGGINGRYLYSGNSSYTGPVFYNGSNAYTVYHTGNVPAWLTSESDTLSTVTARGSSTATATTFTGGLTNRGSQYSEYTGTYGPQLYPTSGGGSAGGGWARSINFADGTGATNFGSIGALGGVNTIDYVYFAYGTDATNYSSGTYLRLYSGNYTQASGSLRTPIFYDSDNTGYYWNPNTSSAHRLQTPTGYLDIGSMNSSWCHFQTDRPGFYFGTKTSHDGGISAYDSNDYAYFPLYYDFNDTNYYLDPNSTSRLNTISLNTISVTSGITGLTSAPLSTQYANAGTTNTWYPMTYQRAQHSGGYVTHLNTGLYKNVSGWGSGSSGWYAAIGGNDGYPTQSWYLTYDGYIQHSLGYIYTSGSFRSPIFYDSNDTGYYVDPRSASVLSGLKLNGVDNNASGSDYILWINKPNNNDWAIGISGQYDYNITYDGAASHSYGVRGLAAGGEYWRVGTDLLYHNSNIRAPIFYDTNNTGYYVDPASTSYINTLTAAGNITANSDIRLKRDIVKIDNAIERVKKLNGVTFTRIDVEDTKKRYAGLIAQEVLEVLPEAVEGTATYSVAYGNMVGLLVEAIKEQQSEIDELKSLVKQLLAK